MQPEIEEERIYENALNELKKKDLPKEKILSHAKPAEKSTL